MNMELCPVPVVEKDGLLYLYYSGWSRGYSVPYSNYTGLAMKMGVPVSKNIASGQSSIEPLMRYLPVFILMGYYGICGTHPVVFYWLKIHDKYEHTYEIKYAYSKDGLTWVQTNETVIKQPIVLSIPQLFPCNQACYSYK